MQISRKCRCAVVALVAAFALTGCDADMWLTPEETTPSVETTDTAPQSEEITAPVEETDEEKIIGIVESVFGADNVILVNYVESTDFLLVRAKGSDNISNALTVKGFYRDMMDVLKKLEPFEEFADLDVDFNIVYGLSSGDAIVVKATYGSETRSECVWDEMLAEDMREIADSLWEHAVVENEFN